MRKERSPRLLLVLPDLRHGGMQTRFLTLARVCERRGDRVTVAAGPGPLEARFGACADTVPPEATIEEAARHDVSVVSLDPSNVHLLGGLATTGRLHVCIHNAPGTFDGWFRPSTLERLRPLLRALHASGRVSLSAASERQARFHEEDLGLHAGAIEAWPNGVEATGNGRVWSGPVRSVGVVTRLSAEKEPVVRAGAELVAAGRELGRDVALDVYGSGPDERMFRELVDAALPGGGWRFHGAVDEPLGPDGAPQVVVAAGRASLEGLVSGRRVVAACWLRHPRGHVGPAVTAGNFTDVAALSFSWGRNEPLGATDVWRDLEAMSDADVVAVRDLARASYSSDAMYDRLIEIVAPTASGDGDPAALARGLAADARALESELAEVRAIADRLWVGLEWLRSAT
jgi:hypothetical protein